ncbi:hypothetical protein [Marispirochaeta sp.]|uniref:hypothetical protein n=1 Tax=Marispirochaeta sp. TaxID=2038653 RepID=UPI0029C82C83|nr:hypothetical protein [Marispirochaeta sp.]
MRTIQRFKWLLRPYFIWYTLALWVIHYALLTLLPKHNLLIDTLLKAFIQVLGILFVLYSINSNMLNLNKKSYFWCIVDWIKEFPRKRTHHLKAASGIAFGSSGESARLTVAINVNDPVDIQVKQLIAGYNHMNKEIAQLQKQGKTIERNLEKTRKELLSELSSQGQEIKKTVQDVLVGDIRLQILGVMLILYSMLIEYGIL